MTQGARPRGWSAHRTHWLMVGATIGTNPLPVCAVRDIAAAQFLASATASAEIAQRQIEKGRRQVSWEKYATATDEAHSCDSHESEHKSRPEVIKIWRRAFRPKARVANYPWPSEMWKSRFYTESDSLLARNSAEDSVLALIQSDTQRSFLRGVSAGHQFFTIRSK